MPKPNSKGLVLGGAVAAFVPTGLSLDRYAHVLNRHLVKHLFDDGEDLGTASVKAREDAVLNPDPVTGVMPAWMIEIYHVNGDPAVNLND